MHVMCACACSAHHALYHELFPWLLSQLQSGRPEGHGAGRVIDIRVIKVKVRMVIDIDNNDSH